jgi:putative membrane protein
LVAFIVFLALIALVVAAVVAVVRHFASRPQAASDAERLLAERFARGEIDDVEYHRRRDALRG